MFNFKKELKTTTGGGERRRGVGYIGSDQLHPLWANEILVTEREADKQLTPQPGTFTAPVGGGRGH